MVTTEQIKKGVINYLDNELMPMIGEGNPLQRVLVGTGIGLLLNKNFAKIEQLKQNRLVAAMGIFDEEGNVDIDILKNEIKKNTPQDTGIPIEVPMVGTLTFRSNDIDKLYTYIENAGSSGGM